MICKPSHIERVARSHSAITSASPGGLPTRLFLMIDAGFLRKSGFWRSRASAYAEASADKSAVRLSCKRTEPKPSPPVERASILNARHAAADAALLLVAADAAFLLAATTRRFR
jgi:hypothetical protein